MGPMKPSRRALDIPPFLVMDVMEAAARLEREGRSVIHLEVGEPDFPTPEPIVAEGQRALRGGDTRYTHSLGTPALREALAERYRTRYGATVDPGRILVTSGSSPAFFLVLSGVLTPGDEVILTDPHYACTPNMISFLGGKPVFVPLREEAGWRPDPEEVARAVTPRTRAILVNSPANPTGAILPPEDLRALARLAAERGLALISDEIYHGLEYGARAHTALEFAPDAFVLDGFSKRYAMTGWRLGWCVVPEPFVRPLQKVAQNFFISAAAFVQRAGIAAVRECEGAVEAMRSEYDRRRRFLLQGLRGAGLAIPVDPQGAFYVLADARRYGGDSKALAEALLQATGVAATPGVDFGSRAEGHIRFSYANSLDNLAEAVRRLGPFLAERARG